MYINTKIQTKFTGGLFLLYVLIALFPACHNTSVKSGQDTRNNKNPKNNVVTIEKTAPRVAVSVIAEQDPNGIYWGLRDTISGKLVLDYAY